MEFREFVYNHIFKYINNNKDMDEMFFYEIIEYFINMYNLNSYLLGVQLKDKSGDTLAAYIPDYKVMNIYAVSLNETIDNYTEYFKDKVDCIEIEIMSYLIIVRALVHELTHVYQSSLIAKADRTLEEELLAIESMYLHNMNIDMLNKLNININSYTRKVNKFIKKYYDSLLCERLAEYYAIDFARNLLNDNYPCLQSFYNDCFIDNLLMGYEDENGILIAPTYRVYSGMHKLMGIKEFEYEYLHNDYEVTKNKVKSLNFDTRIKLGLPISDDEFNSLL